jgi:predicted exporter
MNLSRSALLLLAAWIGALAILGGYAARELDVGSDLRLFMPTPKTRPQQLLLEEIGEGPASRVLVIALQGAAPETLADVSRALVAELGGNDDFQVVSNGELALDAFPDRLLAYRYLLSPTSDSQRFATQYLHDQLQARARDLASPVASFLEPWLPRDPTLELLKVLQSWQPMQEPNRLYDVWFDREGKRALLIAETRAAAFDPAGQRVALDALQRAFATVNMDHALTMTVSGAGTFSVMMQERTRDEAQTLGTIATAGMIVLLIVAYRRIGSVVLSSLPIASAALAGLAAVSALFGTIHGITLAFGFTLIGVAQDYPLHLLSHSRRDHSPNDTVRELWPTLATGVASTCIAYLTFVFSGVIGLAQLACFTIAGLAVAALTTRFLLPALVDRNGRDYGESSFLARLWERIAHLPRPIWAAPLAILACVAIASIAPQPWWENDLGKLTPVPTELLQQDQMLRAQLGAPDVRYLAVLDAGDADSALARLENIDGSLRGLVEAGTITGYDHAARYLPTRARQLERQKKLPDEPTLRASLQAALVDTPFRTDVFEPFIVDMAQARSSQPLTLSMLQETPLATTVEALLTQRDARATALITFATVNDERALRGFIAGAGSDLTLLDLKDASETLVANQRSYILWSLAIAALLLVGVVAYALRSPRRMLRVLAPMALTTLIAIATLRGLGVSMTLFHLIALMLAAGLGLDYALFFERAADDPREQRRTLHAVLISSCSTLLVFALLATSTLPVLQAIGVTVSIGVVSNFILALLLTRPPETTHA